MVSKYINSSSTSVIVNMSGGIPYIQNNGSLCGQIRYNTVMQQLEVYDGSMWHGMSGSTTIGLTSNAESAIIWAQKKMSEEHELKAKMEKYPSLQHAYDQFKILEALVHEEESKELR